ncbi:HAMP domain-containing histidine kinase [Granulicella sp. WH15]|nr:HAMP domain-containing histidine kinase [Granulicella sp. WH15]
MALVTVIVTALFMLLIRHRLGAQVTEDLSQDLTHSVITFQNLQAERLAALERENALLAELPTLKALMTSGDDLTIQDGATEFWQLSGNDLFALANPSGRIVAVYSKNAPPDATLHTALQSLVSSPDKQYLIDGSLLYACSLRPLYFGGDDDGTLLGYVISGISIGRTVRQISEPTGVEATFLSGGHIVASTLTPANQAGLASHPSISSSPSTVTLGGTRFLSATEDLSTSATSPLELVVLKSFAPAERRIARIDHMVLSTGLLALLSGTVLMITLSRLLTRPLEELSDSVKAFGMGDSNFRIPRHGTQEVLQLSAAFDRMRDEIQQANRARLESERLATIGRMASSVSHDLRHYLAAVYANSEFLASDRLSLEERAEIFADIRTAVLGTTDMIESLLVFSRTGASVRRTPELLSTLLDRALALVRSHPDSHGVKLITSLGEPTQTAAFVDGKQIERAIYNLLLNACQAAHTAETGTVPSVTVTLEAQPEHMIVNIIDNGPGVPENIRKSLFDPFVSEGKQKGTGLGLTLAHRIAVEHGGEVILLSSCPGETIFQMRVKRGLRTDEATSTSDVERQDRVIAHEKVWT